MSADGGPRQTTTAPGTAAADPILLVEDRALRKLASSRDRPYYDADADAAARDAYYADLELTGDPAANTTAMQALLQHTHARPRHYSPSEELYPWVDIHPDGGLYNIYSGIRVDPEEAIRQDARIARLRQDRLTEIVRTRATMAPRELHAAAQQVTQELHFNCEHVVPQSWFSEHEPMRGDLHHLFTCEPRCNSDRGSIPFAELDDSVPIVRGCGRKTGDVGFEPVTGKGAAARATLYFLLRYPGVIGDQARELKLAAVATLLAWHGQDPVSEYERHRNAAIAEAQGNRNPLIDAPEMAERLDFTTGFGTPSVPGAQIFRSRT